MHKSISVYTYIHRYRHVNLQLLIYCIISTVSLLIHVKAKQESSDHFSLLRNATQSLSNLGSVGADTCTCTECFDKGSLVKVEESLFCFIMSVKKHFQLVSCLELNLFASAKPSTAALKHILSY